MIRENLNTNPTPAPTPKKFDLIKQRVKEVYGRIATLTSPYKILIRIFLFVLGTLFLILVISVLISSFRDRDGAGAPSTTASPIPSATGETKGVDENEEKLSALKKNVFQLDVYHGRFSPPSLKFDSGF